jgi:hypothetical protein
MNMTFDKLNLLIKEYDLIETDVYVYDYFNEIRNQVDLHREQLIEKIHKQSEEMLALLKQQEEGYKKNSVYLMRILFTLKTIKLPGWRKEIRCTEANEHEVETLFNEINQTIFEMENEISKYKNDSLMDKQIEFIPSELESCFGELKIKQEFQISENFGKLEKKFNIESKSQYHQISLSQ